MVAQSVVRDTVLVYFEQGLSGIAPSLRGNQKSLDSIAAITGRYSRNPQFHLYVKGWASPEGTSAFNTVLSHDRAAAVIACIESLSGRTLPPSAYTLAGMGIDWEGLSRILSRGASFPGRDEVLRIIRNTPVWQITDGKVTGSETGAEADAGDLSAMIVGLPRYGTFSSRNYDPTDESTANSCWTLSQETYTETRLTGLPVFPQVLDGSIALNLSGLPTADRDGDGREGDTAIIRLSTPTGLWEAGIHYHYTFTVEEDGTLRHGDPETEPLD